MSLSDLIDAHIDRHAGSPTTLTEYRAAHYRDIARSLVACQSPNEAPEAEHDEIEHALRLRIDQDGGVDVVTPHVLDPAWGLERMIAKLVGLSAGALTPFSTQ